MPGFGLSNDTWDHFIDGGMLRPFLVKRPFDRAFVTREEMWAMFVAASDIERDLLGPVVQVFSNGGRLPADYLELLPTQADSDPAEFTSRLGANKRAEALTLFMQHGQCYLPHLFPRIQEFLFGLHERSFPVYRTYTDLFFGRYPATPTGIHRDSSDIFSYVVSGRKKYLFWPHDAFGKVDPGVIALNSTDFRGQSTSPLEIVADEGDIVYFPAGEWHIAVNGDWVSTFNVCIDRTSSSSIASTLSEGALQSVRPGDPAVGSPIQIDKLEAHVLQALRVARTRLDSSEMAERIIQRELERLSASGFNAVPDLEVRSAGEGCALRRFQKLLVSRSGNSKLIVALDGHSVVVGASAPVLDSIRQLNGGKRYVRQASTSRDVLAVMDLVAQCDIPSPAG